MNFLQGVSPFDQHIAEDEHHEPAVQAAYAQALAKVDDARANVKVLQAQLDSDQVNYDHAKRDWDRAQLLSGKQALAIAAQSSPDISRDFRTASGST